VQQRAVAELLARARASAVLSSRSASVSASIWRRTKVEDVGQAAGFPPVGQRQRLIRERSARPLSSVVCPSVAAWQQAPRVRPSLSRWRRPPRQLDGVGRVSVRVANPRCGPGRPGQPGPSPSCWARTAGREERGSSPGRRRCAAPAEAVAGRSARFRCRGPCCARRSEPWWYQRTASPGRRARMARSPASPAYPTLGASSAGGGGAASGGPARPPGGRGRRKLDGSATWRCSRAPGSALTAA